MYTFLKNCLWIPVETGTELYCAVKNLKSAKSAWCHMLVAFMSVCVVCVCVQATCTLTTCVFASWLSSCWAACCLPVTKNQTAMQTSNGRWVSPELYVLVFQLFVLPDLFFSALTWRSCCCFLDNLFSLCLVVLSVSLTDGICEPLWTWGLNCLWACTPELAWIQLQF